jgi:ethanolamine utilization protein EutM
MKHYEAIGVIETQYFTVALEMLDQVTKTAAVEFLSSKNDLGGKLVSIIVGGSISDVTVAIEQAKYVNSLKQSHPLKNAVMITNPSPEILKFIIPKEQQIKEEQAKLIEEEINNE